MTFGFGGIFLFPPFFLACPDVFSHIILLHTDFFFLFVADSIFFPPFQVGGSLSFLRELGGDDGSLDKWGTLHKFFLASCRFQHYTLHLNNSGFF